MTIIYSKQQYWLRWYMRKMWLRCGNFDLWVGWAIIFQCTKTTKNSLNCQFVTEEHCFAFSSVSLGNVFWSCVTFQDSERSVHLLDPPLMVLDDIQLLCLVRLLLGVLCRHLVSHCLGSRWVLKHPWGVLQFKIKANPTMPFTHQIYFYSVMYFVTSRNFFVEKDLFWRNPSMLFQWSHQICG